MRILIIQSLSSVRMLVCPFVCNFFLIFFFAHTHIHALTCNYLISFLWIVRNLITKCSFQAIGVVEAGFSCEILGILLKLLRDSWKIYGFLKEYFFIILNFFMERNLLLHEWEKCETCANIYKFDHYGVLFRKPSI